MEHRAEGFANDYKVTDSPILSAILEGHTGYVQTCAKQQLRLYSGPSDFYTVTPLSLAILNGQGDIVKLLLGIYYGLSVLSLAMLEGHHDIVELLLKNGAKADVADSSAIITGYLNRRHDVIELLLEYGAKSDSKDEDGEAPLPFIRKTLSRYYSKVALKLI